MQDRNPDDREAAEEKFKEITSAYQTLTGGGGAGPGGFGGGQGFGSQGGFHGGFSRADMNQANRIFREFFGGRRPEEVRR